MSETPTPDGLLLRRYRDSGDEAAFAELRRRHGRLVLATCRRETGDAALAEDAAQGVFLLLIRKGFDERASLAGWLHGAARLVSRNLLREEGRRARRERRAFVEPTEPDDAWNAVSPHVDAALASLRADDREAVLLRFAGDLSLAEVGTTLGIGENAARMRVARALERMRKDLRKAGVGVSVLLLGTLCSTRLAEADGTSFPPGEPSARARRLARRGMPWTHGFAWKPVLAGAVAVGLAGGAIRAATAGPPRLTPAETERLFRSSAGTWRGNLEFADDASGVRTKTPTAVEVSSEAGGLRLVARYPSFRNVDTTTIVPQPDGRFAIETGGAGSSHRLDGRYDLVRQKDGVPAFVGTSAAVGSEVRLRLNVGSGALTLQEEVRRGGAYRFRNRFDLRR